MVKRVIPIIASVSFLVAFGCSSAVFARDVNADVVAALTNNPAFLAKTSGLVTTFDFDMAAPGLTDLQSLVEEWYDFETGELTIDLDDFADSEEAAQSAAENLNAIFNAASKLNLTTTVGATVSKFGLGVSVQAATDITSDISFEDDDSTPLGYVAVADIEAGVLVRADVIGAFGIPMGQKAGLGIAGKYTLFATDYLDLYSTAEEVDGGILPNPSEYFEVGEGYLVDAGFYYSPIPQLQIDVAVKDIGTIDWEVQEALWDEDPLAVAPLEHPDLTKVVGGITVTPIKQLVFGLRYDENIFNEGLIKASAQFKPTDWLSLKAGYTVETAAVEAGALEGVLTLGAGVRIGFLGFETGISYIGDDLAGANARVNISF